MSIDANTATQRPPAMAHVKRYLRYLQIACVSYCVFACVLLIVFWARSYSREDVLEGILHQERINSSDLFRTKYVRFTSLRGAIGIEYEPVKLRQENEYTPWWFNSGPAHEGGFTWHFMNDPGLVVLNLPHWFALAVIAAVGLLLWLPNRFSLRTLLITTAALAVTLGLIVLVSGDLIRRAAR